MPRPMGHIRILISSRVLLDLEEADRIFKEKGVTEYADYMLGRGNYTADYNAEAGGRLLKKGPLWNFAIAALKLNQTLNKPVIEIGMYCKDDVETAGPIFRSIDMQGLKGMEFRLATAGNKLEASDHETFETDLLLTRNPDDAQVAVNAGIAAATINFPPHKEGYDRKTSQPIRLWVDGDAVAFGSSAEVIYRTKGLTEYVEEEFQAFKKKIEPGPFTKILAKISQLNARFPKGQQPFEISLLTARGGGATSRVFNIANDLGINFNGRMYFVGGAAKVNALKAHRPDLYLDDQMVHLTEASNFCPTGHVAYPEGSPMYIYLKELAAKATPAPAPQKPAGPAPG